MASLKPKMYRRGKSSNLPSTSLNLLFTWSYYSEGTEGERNQNKNQNQHTNKTQKTEEEAQGQYKGGGCILLGGLPMPSSSLAYTVLILFHFPMLSFKEVGTWSLELSYQEITSATCPDCPQKVACLTAGMAMGHCWQSL